MASFCTRVALVSALLVSFVVSPQACAFTNQWEWTVSGLPGIYSNKAEAVAAMHAGYPWMAPLTQEVGLNSISSSQAQYKYVAPKTSPNYTGWLYSALDRNGVGQTFATEAEAVAFRTAELAANRSICNSVSMSPNSEWQSQYTPPPYGSSNEVRYYTVSDQGSAAYPTPHCFPTSYNDQINRSRSIACPAFYHLTTTAPYCQDDDFNYISGHPLECPKGGVSTKVGDPCDVASGDLSQSETDYIGGGLRFTRHYHSITLESHHGLGVGWAQEFSAHLVVSGGLPNGLLRPDGHHDALQWMTDQYVSLSGSGIHVVQSGTQWSAYLQDGSHEVYDASGNLIQLVAKSGAITALSYTNNQLTLITGPFGHNLQLSYTDNFLTQLTLPGGASIQYGYDSNGNLIQVTYPDSKVRTYQYENTSFPNHLTGITDESNVRFATFAYDALGRVTSAQHAGGAEGVTLVYHTADSVVTDAAGTVSTYTFTSDTGLSRRVTGLDRNSLAQSFVVPSSSADSQRRTTQSTDARGTVTTFSYDRDHLTSKTEAYGTPRARTTSYVYNSTQSSQPTLITELNRTTAFTYDTSGNVLTRTITDTSVTPNVSRTWTYTYNSYGQVLTEDGPRTDVTDVTTYTYYTCTTGYQCGQLNTISNPLSQVTTYNTYNANGQPLTITDPNGVVTTLAYDARQRLISRQMGAETTTFDYWPTGLLKMVTLPDGSYLQYTYDNAHRLTRIDDSAGNNIQYTLDAMGNRTAENVYDPTSFLTRTRTRVFNSLNQLWKELGAAGTLAVTTEFLYDANGNQTNINAPLSRNTVNAYDELNRLKQITDPASGNTQFGYDANDNLTSVTDPRTLATTYTYTGFGDLKTQVSPDTGTTTNTYDSGGNLKTSKDARNKTGTYSYDALNRVTQVAYGDQTITYTYDAGTNGKGHLTGASDSNHTLAWVYDAQGRITGKGQTTGTVTKSVGYGYTNGRQTSMTMPSGQLITYGYNSNHQIVSLTIGSTTVLNNVLYEPFGPIAGWTWGNGTFAVRTYDTDGKLTQIDSAGLKTFSYDDAFRITGVTDTVVPANSWTYGYDPLDRLTSAVKTGTTRGWTYDANGNRLTETGTSPSTYTIAGTNNRLSSITGAVARSYTYDASGNVLTFAGNTAVFNNRGRLKTMNNGSTTATYVYDALGQLIKQSGGTSGTKLYMYDEAGHFLGEYGSGGALIREMVWFGDIPVAALTPKTGGVDIWYIHTDQINTPRIITRPSDNKKRWRWDTEPFGTGIENTNPEGLGSYIFNVRFAGQVADSQAGLRQNMFRDYDAVTGRYVESDPIGLRAGVNTYGYVLNNPLQLTDPKGLKCVLVGTRALTNWSEIAGSASYGPKSVTGIASGVNVVCVWTRTRYFDEERMVELVWDCWECRQDECSSKNCEWKRKYGGIQRETRSNHKLDRKLSAGFNFHDGYNDIEEGGTAFCPDPWGGPPARLESGGP